MTNIEKDKICIEGTLLMLDDATPHVAVPIQAIVGAYGHTPLQVAATTLNDENGKYRFVNLKPGWYQVRCQVMDGYVYYPESRMRPDPNPPLEKGDLTVAVLEKGELLPPLQNLPLISLC